MSRYFIIASALAVSITLGACDEAPPITEELSLVAEPNGAGGQAVLFRVAEPVTWYSICASPDPRSIGLVSWDEAGAAQAADIRARACLWPEDAIGNDDTFEPGMRYAVTAASGEPTVLTLVVDCAACIMSGQW
jgi:hypothetical protein